MVNMLCKIDSGLKDKMIYTKNGQKFIFGKLNKSVYGTLLGAILLYEKMAVQLHEWNYIMNLYNACTFNKIVNGKQITVQFFMDKLHISCENMNTIDGLIKDLNNKFKTNFRELVITKGKVHDYLGRCILCYSEFYADKSYRSFVCCSPHVHSYNTVMCGTQ